MKIIITADLHNGIPDKLDDSIWAMDIIRQYAITKNIQHIIIAGDLFHDRININIPVLNKVYDFFIRVKKDRQHWYCFPGNHDLFLKNSWEINSLHPFRDLISIIEETRSIEIDKQKFWIVPFVYQEKEYMKIINEIESNNHTKNDILLTHIGANNAKLNECFLLKNWSIINFDETKFKRIFSGHFHCHQSVGKLLYVGSPIPFRFDEGVIDHGFITYDTKSESYEFIKIYDICGQFSNRKPPDYITIIDKDIVSNLKWVNGNYVRIIQLKDYNAMELHKIRNLLMKKGALKVYFLIQQKQITEAKNTINSKQIGTPEALFKAYIIQDKPELDITLLKSLFPKIAHEAEEKMTIEIDNSDAEA